jgi:hypothetical protein
MTNYNSNTNSSYNVFPKQFVNYINYELSFFEKVADKKFYLIF